MPRIRPRRTRTRRDNRREPLLLSHMNPQDYNVRTGEAKSISCPDCRTWHRIVGETRLKIIDHGACLGSNQLVVIDIDVRRWQRQADRLLRDGMWADQRRAAQQFFKPTPAPPRPITKMATTPQTALYAYRDHFKRCQASEMQGRCTGNQRCTQGARLAKVYEQRVILDRERSRFDRTYATRASQKTAAEWTALTDATTADAKKTTAKRSGTAVEDLNNLCRHARPGAVSEFRGPDLPLWKQA